MKIKNNEKPINDNQWNRLSEKAWEAREHAYLMGDTKVGCALITDDDQIFSGCNIEHRFRCHDIHAEVNAISSMVAAGYTKIIALIVVAERKQFTPCGSCMDWIFQFGSASCMVAYQIKRDAEIIKFRAADLMPFYPG